MLNLRHSLQHDTKTNIAELIGQIFYKSWFQTHSAYFLLSIKDWMSCQSLLLD